MKRGKRRGGRGRGGESRRKKPKGNETIRKKKKKNKENDFPRKRGRCFEIVRDL